MYNTISRESGRKRYNKEKTAMADNFEQGLGDEILDLLFAETVGDTLDKYEIKRLPETGLLDDCLEVYTKDRLLNLAGDNGVDVKRSWNKDRIIADLSEEIMDRINERFLLLGESSLQILQQFSDGEFESDEITEEVITFYLSVYPVAVRMGLLYSLDGEEDVITTIPIEVKDALDVFLANFDQIEKEYRSEINVWEQIDEVLRVGVHLYGVLTSFTVVDLWEIRHPDFEEKLEEHLNFIKYLYDILPLIVAKNGYYFLNDYIIGDSVFFGEAEVEEYYYARDDKWEEWHVTYYEPTQEDVQYYAKHSFDRRSFVYKRLRKFVMRRSEDVDMVMELIEGNITEGYELSALMEEIAAYELLQFDTEKQLEKFVDLYVELYNNSRLWENLGHTPKEMVVSIDE